MLKRIVDIRENLIEVSSSEDSDLQIDGTLKFKNRANNYFTALSEVQVATVALQK